MRFVLAVVFLSSSLFAQSLPDVSEVMRRAADAAANRKSLQYTMESRTTHTPRGQQGRTLTTRATVTTAAPSKFHVEVVDGSGPGARTHISDGATSWDYIAAAKQYSRSASGQRVNLLGIATLEWIGGPPGSDFQGEPKMLREEAIEMDGKMYDCWVIADGMKSGTLGARISNASIVSWISKDFLLPLRNEVTLTLAGNPSVDVKSAILLRSVKIDEPIAADTFTFTPPPDASEFTAPSIVDLTGSPAPAFDVTDLEGKPHNLAAMKGKPILLDFFATWCQPCADSTPAIERINAQFKDKGLITLAIDVDEPRSILDAFLKPRPMPYPVIFGRDSGLDSTYKVSGLPTFIVIDGGGTVAGQLVGFGHGAEKELLGILARVGLGTAPATETAVNLNKRPGDPVALEPPYAPSSLAIDPLGNVLVADSAGGRILRFGPSGPPVVVAGTGQSANGPDNGIAIFTPLNQPSALAMDAAGDLYIGEAGNGRLRKLKADGTLNTLATVPKHRGSIALDASGNLYVGIDGNRIQKISPNGMISDFAGSGAAGNRGDGAAALTAQLNSPSGVAADAGGNLYIADTLNHRVRRISVDGTIFLAAGIGSEGFSGDGSLAVFAQLKNPAAVAVDGARNLYIADSGNYRIRKVTPNGTMTTVAGSGVEGFAGDGGPAIQAQFGTITSIAVDKDGSLYIADTANRRIRKVAVDGTISTVAATAPDSTR